MPVALRLIARLPPRGVNTDDDLETARAKCSNGETSPISTLEGIEFLPGMAVSSSNNPSKHHPHNSAQWHHLAESDSKQVREYCSH